MDFLKFALARKLLVVTALIFLSDSQHYSTSRGLDIQICIIYLAYRSGFWNRSMDFLKFSIAGELLVASTCNLYQMILRQVD